jgi:hypothetical protein
VRTGSGAAGETRFATIPATPAPSEIVFADARVPVPGKAQGTLAHQLQVKRQGQTTPWNLLREPAMDRRLLDYQPLLEALGPSEFEREAARTADEEVLPFSGSAELRLAAELLLATDDAQLRAFLHELIAAIGVDGGRLARTPLASALVARLVQVGQPVLRPLRCIALGRGTHGSAMRAARILGLELEGLSPEDQEFALARQFIRFAGAAVRAAIRGQGATPAVVARALRAAAEEYAPGLLACLQTPSMHGRWVRTGNRIALLGL